jgi:hypothetical protein
MRKRNKLYTANKWNRPMFAEGVDREHQNIFDGMFSSTLNTSLSKPNLLGNNYFSKQGLLSNNSSGFNIQTPQLSKPSGYTPIDWSNSISSKNAVQTSQNLVNNFGTEAQKNNPLSNYGSGKNTEAAQTSGFGGWGQVAATAGSAVADNIKIAGTRNGLYDAADPVYWLADGRESAAGNGLSDAGVATFKAGAQSGNPWVMLAGAGLKVTGGLVNAAWGIKTDKKKEAALKSGIETNRNFNSNASSYDEIVTPEAVVDNTNGVYKGGWFSGGKARKKTAELKRKVDEAEAWANNSVNNNIHNIASNQLETMYNNYYDLGGPLGNNTGAINYGFMADYLTTKNKAIGTKNKVSNNIFGSLQSPTMFALGGDMQTNGADFSNGLAHIDAGGSHEESPYDGVQVGISRENGEPNLVEEGETIFDDYVFSKRIKVDAQTKDKFHLGKNSDLTFADVSKKLEKESEERPNDAISQAGLTKQMHALAEEQERQKNEEQQREAQEAFEQLPPEQQQEIMQQMAIQEQQAQQQEAQQAQAMQAEQQMQGQQEPQQMVDEQMQAEQQGMQPQMEEQQLNACGGKMNRFDKGGDLKRAIYKLLNVSTDSDFKKWLTDHKTVDVTDWENVLENKPFMEALTGANPALRHAISQNYDFGTYTPPANTLTFDFKHGGWGSEDYNAWNGSTDAAWQEALKKGLVKEGMGSEEIGKALMQTDAYKRGTDWLKASDANRLKYLQAIYSSEDAPQAARDFAGKYVDGNGWLKDVKKDYQTIFEDPNGTGVRNTHPGTYWKTPNEILRDKTSGNYVVNDDGTVEEIIGDVPKDWKLDSNYAWQDESADHSLNYYRRPSTNATSGSTDADGNPTDELEPVHKSTWGRYAGLFGPAVGLGMQMAGIGKPDYSKLDAALEIANGAPAFAEYKPIGNYLQYKPMDIWFEQNRQNANARATDRAIRNNASPLGTKMAGLLANGYNNQIASGNLYRQALEYNDAQRQKVAEFNKDTDKYNASAFTQTSATNAEIANNNRRFRAQLAADAARQRMDADASWNQGIYANVSKLFSNLGEWGKENAQHNMIADMAADNLFGIMSDKQNIGNGYIVKKRNKGTTSGTMTVNAAKGGKLRRKRGLTF